MQGRAGHTRIRLVQGREGHTRIRLVQGRAGYAWCKAGQDMPFAGQSRTCLIVLCRADTRGGLTFRRLPRLWLCCAGLTPG